MPDENIITMDMTPVSAKRILREIIEADSGKIFFTHHAQEKLVARAITRKQAICCLKHGRFVEEPYRSANGNWQMKLSVRSAGDLVSVVCALDHDSDGNYILVITVIKEH